MSSAVHSLQKAILDPNQSLTQLLRQTKLITAKLGVKDVEQWVDYELNGYPREVAPPAYRVYFTHSLEFHNGYRGIWQFAGNLTIDTKAYQPIAEIENYSKGDRVAFPNARPVPIRDDNGEQVPSEWPQRFVVMGLQFKRIIDAVTNALLNWTIEMEQRGIKGEDMDFNEKEKQAATHQTFNIQKFTGVFGNVTGSQVTVYDYSSVSQLLLDHQVPKAERRELEDLMDDLKTAPPEKKPSLIQKGKDWIVKNKEFLGASAEAVGRAIGAAIDKS